MLPPMIYRVLNPDLVGLENEGAYLLICKEVLPAGMLGLMLGGMIFATASSVNTTLNLAASVITNDIFKVLKPNSSVSFTMKVAKISTLCFGIATILVAFLVPAAGGIVNVVLSIGAVTGCSLYGPPIWALFSKRHTGKSILWISILSLLINVGLKFFGELVLGQALNRTDEMLLGALLPLGLLAGYELYAKYTHKVSEDYEVYIKSQDQDTIEVDSDASQNSFGFKVLAVTLMVVGLLIMILGIIAEAHQVLVIILGVVIMLLAAIIYRKVKN
jgi:hypothetical protein